MGAAIRTQLVIEDRSALSNQAASTSSRSIVDLDEIILGIDAIAAFIFGEQGSRRKIRYLVKTSHLPVFPVGRLLCARRSALLRWNNGHLQA